MLQATSLGSVASDPEYNAFAELDTDTVTVGGDVVYAVDYERDKLGRITQKTETVDGVTTTVAYTYDDAGRLDTVTRNGSLEKDFDYDANGNRTHVNGVEVGIYDAQDRLLSYDPSLDGTTSLSPSPLTGEGWGEGVCEFTYTANGELDQRDCGGQLLDTDYDVFGNLRHATLPDGTQIDYVIDGQNRRIGKKIDGELVQGFLYQDQLNPVAELDGSGAVTARFVYADKPNVPSHMLKDGNTYRIVSDHLGSVRLVIDVSSGEIVQRMNYDAWGNVIEDSNPGFQPFGFAGGIYDRDTGLVRFGARDYDPVTGRWTAKDPIGLSGGVNVYAYTFNDPTNFSDSSGLIPGSLLYQALRPITRQTGREATVSGMVADSVGSTALTASGAGSHMDGTIGTALDTYQAVGGMQTIGLSASLSAGIYGAGAATGSISGAAALPIGLAALGGYETGDALYRLYSRLTGRTLGGDIYEWWNSWCY